jgi:hypothetical protein
MVFVQNDAKQPPLSPVYSGPYRVLEQIGNRTDTVSTLWLKAAYLPSSAIPALPLRRSRPPKNPTLPLVQKMPLGCPVLLPVKKVNFSESAPIMTGRPRWLRHPPVRYQAWILHKLFIFIANVFALVSLSILHCPSITSSNNITIVLMNLIMLQVFHNIVYVMWFFAITFLFCNTILFGGYFVFYIASIVLYHSSAPVLPGPAKHSLPL